MKNKLLDRTGKEIKQGSFILISTINTNTGKLRVGYVKSLIEDRIMKIRTICPVELWWKPENDNKVVMGVVDLYNCSNHSRLKDILLIENPSQFMTEKELNFAKSKGWI